MKWELIRTETPLLDGLIHFGFRAVLCRYMYEPIWYERVSKRFPAEVIRPPFGLRCMIRRITPSFFNPPPRWFLSSSYFDNVVDMTVPFQLIFESM